MFGLLILGQVQNFFTWGQKLGRQAKLKENVNTLRVYVFFEVIIMNLAQNVLSW